MASLPMKGFVYEITSMVHGQSPIGDGRRMPCMDIEMNTAECLEAYGVHKGVMVCQKFMEDLSECKHANLRAMRYRIMREERLKKVVKGELPWNKRWGAPYAYDAFVVGTFVP